MQTSPHPAWANILRAARPDKNGVYPKWVEVHYFIPKEAHEFVSLCHSNHLKLLEAERLNLPTIIYREGYPPRQILNWETDVYPRLPDWLFDTDSAASR